MKTMKACRSSLDRQGNESVRITRIKAHNLLNSKNKFDQTAIIKNHSTLEFYPIKCFCEN